MAWRQINQNPKLPPEIKHVEVFLNKIYIVVAVERVRAIENSRVKLIKFFIFWVS